MSSSAPVDVFDNPAYTVSESLEDQSSLGTLTTDDREDEAPPTYEDSVRDSACSGFSIQSEFTTYNGSSVCSSPRRQSVFTVQNASTTYDAHSGGKGATSVWKTWKTGALVVIILIVVGCIAWFSFVTHLAFNKDPNTDPNIPQATAGNIS